MLSAQRKQSVRERLANVEELSLQLLMREAKSYAEGKKNPPESFFKKLKIIGDQIRVDFRLPSEPADQPPADDPPQAPFDGLRLADTGEDAA